MKTVKVGDKVRRIPSMQKNRWWPHGDAVVEVTNVDYEGRFITGLKEGMGGESSFSADYFELAPTPVETPARAAFKVGDVVRRKKEHLTQGCNWPVRKTGPVEVTRVIERPDSEWDMISVEGVDGTFDAYRFELVPPKVADIKDPWAARNPFKEGWLREDIAKASARVAKSTGASALGQQVGGDHYKSLPIQPIEYITANKLGWCEGNIVKYITRWKQKGGAKDIDKVIHYANLLKQIEGLN
jgi:hypothetical protein